MSPYSYWGYGIRLSTKGSFCRKYRRSMYRYIMGMAAGICLVPLVYEANQQHREFGIGQAIEPLLAAAVIVAVTWYFSSWPDDNE